MIKNLRWYIVGLLTLVTAINYLDRNALSVAQTVLEDQFGMTNADYGHIVSVFLLAYGLMHPVSGRIVDWLGSRRGLAFGFVWWSLASIGHAFCSGITSFGIMRFVLGFGESGNFPAAIKTVGEWFPAKERALATGIFNVGAGLGAVIAPPLIGGLIMLFGWRAAFVATGAIGFLWLIPWLALSGKPEGHPRITPEELAYIRGGQSVEPTEELQKEAGGGVWKEALSRKELWALMVARFLSDPVWLFFAFWIPKYFKTERGFDLKDIALFTWMPFLAADVGSVVGGWLSSYFVKRGYSTLTARKIAMCMCAALMPVAIFSVRVQSWQLAIVCLSVAAFGHQSWSASMLTLPTDLFPKRMVASTYGLAAMMGVLGSAWSQWNVGTIIDSIGYVPVLTVAGLLHPIAAIIIVAFVRSKRKESVC
ncbi:MAG: MFS transporter [Armatimonadota bacterium]|nr:MFS transporter [bacterium]